MAAKPIPDNYTAITPYLYIKGAAQAIEFYKNAFGAVEILRMPMPGGTIGHAELKFGSAIIMLADENAAHNVRGPQTLGGTSVGILLYCDKVDEVFNRAISLGGKQERPLQNQFYGDRTGTLLDPFGHRWTIATHVEDVTEEEMNKRLAAMSQGQG